MPQYDNTNRGAAWPNDRKREGQKDPEFTGSINVEGKEFWLDCWVNWKKNPPADKPKMPQFSYRVRPKEGHQSPPQQQAQPEHQTPCTTNIMNEIIESGEVTAIAIKREEVELRQLESKIAWDEKLQLAHQVAGSNLFGVTSVEQAMTLFAVAEAEGRPFFSALQRYDIIEGKPSMKAQTMQADFTSDGGVIQWHLRTDEIVGATFYSKETAEDSKKPEVVKMMNERFGIIWRLQTASPEDKPKLMMELSSKAVIGAETIVRTYDDAFRKGLAVGGNGKVKVNWHQSSRMMLTARVLTEGIRLINPALLGGMYDPDEITSSREIHVPEKPKTKAAIEAEITELQRVAGLDETPPTRASELYGKIAELRIDLDEMAFNIDTSPVGEDAAPEQPDTPPVGSAGERWQDHVVTCAKSKSFKGKRLGDLSTEELETLNGWVNKNAVKNMVDPVFIQEKDAVNTGWKATFLEDKPSG